MTKDERSSALDRRKDRIVKLVRQKKTVKEICDILGLDPENEPKYLINKALEGTGMKAAAGVPENWKPVGLKGGNSNFCTNLRFALERLLDKHKQDYIAVAEITGLTQAQQKKAVSKNQHDWTLSQIQRLADGLGESFPELVAKCNSGKYAYARTNNG